jgi:hypothetical protein
MHVRVSVHAAGNGTFVFYDGHGHPFSEVEGWHAPAGRRTCEPRPLAQDGQIGDGTAGGCHKTWDPADESLAGQPDRASADSQVRPGPRPQTLCPHQVKTTQAGPGSEGYLHPPCRFFTSLAVAEMEIGWRPEHPRLLVCWAWSIVAKVRLSSVSIIREAGPGELEFLSLDSSGSENLWSECLP